MNIDDLKNTWNEENLENIPEINTEQRNSLHLPLESMRKNMRMEFWFTLGVFIFTFIVILIREIPFKFMFYIELLVVSMMFVTAFFFSRFFKLYKEMSNPELNTYDGLKDLLHQFELNKQYYLSFYVSFIPFLVCEMIIVLEFMQIKAPISNLQIALTAITTIVLGTLFVFAAGKWWFQKFYGKHIDKIKLLVEELKR